MDRSEPENSDDVARWWLLSLGDAIQASPVLQTVLEAFTAVGQQAGAAPDMSLWLCTESDGLHCQQTLYFSPGCRRLALQFRATPCRAPARSRVQWFAGASTVADDAGVDGK